MFSKFSDISILVSLICSKCRFDKDKGTSTLLFNLSLRKIIKQNFFTLCCGITFKIIFNQLSVSQMKFMQSKYTCSIKNKYKLLKKKKANKHIPWTGQCKQLWALRHSGGDLPKHGWMQLLRRGCHVASAAEPTVNLKHQQGRETDRGCGRGRGYVSAGDHLGLTRSPFYHSQGSKQEVIESFCIFFSLLPPGV